jgi:hypothetical protein
MLEMRVQIDALREAFSADTSKPFELKANFPLGSPTPQPDDTPTMSHASYATVHTQDPANLSASQVNYNMIQPITPPISAVSEDERDSASPANQNMGMMQNQDQSSHGSDGALQSQVQAQQQWNPTRLFE